MTKQIALTKGFYSLVDDADYDYLAQWNWFAAKNRWTVYACRKSRSDDGKIIAVFMHNTIIQPSSGFRVDHIDRNGINNQRTNLRIASNSQNMMNRTKYGNGSSQYKGVDWSKYNKAWRARISVNRKRISLGYYSSEIDAAMAYDKAATEHFGSFAVLNFPIIA